MSEESNKVESLLFSSGRKMREDEIVQLTNLKLSDVKKGLEELKEKYERENNSLMLFSEGDSWKLGVREKYLGIVQRIVTETELDRSIMETLAVIAWKYPILQADVIKIRNNKAYEHMKELEEAGFISREVHGRTRSIKLTQKFFDYFDLPKGEQTRETFRQAVPEEIRESIERREGEITETEGKIEEAKTQKKEIERKMKEDKEKRVELIDEMGAETELEIYEEKPEETEEEQRRAEEIKHNLIGVEVITEEKEKEQREKEIDKKAEEIVANIDDEEISPEVEKLIDKLLHPPGYKPKQEVEEETEDNEKESEETKEDDSEKKEKETKEKDLEKKEKDSKEKEDATDLGKNYTEKQQEESEIEQLSDRKEGDFQEK